MKKAIFFLLIVVTKITPSICQSKNGYENAIQNAERLMKSNGDNKYEKILSNLDDAEDFAGNDETKKKKIRSLRKQALIAIQNEKKKADDATKRAENETENARLERNRAEQERIKAEDAKKNAESQKRIAEEKSDLAAKKTAEFELALKEALEKNEHANFQRDSFKLKREIFASSTTLFFYFIAEQNLQESFMYWSRKNIDYGDIDKILLEMVYNSKSIDTEEERQNWKNLFPMMNNGQKAKLMLILGKEKVAMKEIDLKNEKFVKDILKGLKLKEMPEDDWQKYNRRYEKFTKYIESSKKGNDNIKILMTKDPEEVSQFIGFLTDSVSKSSIMSFKLNLYPKIIELSKHLTKLTTLRSDSITTSQCYNNYGYYLLFANDFKRSLQVLEEGLSFNKDNIFIKSNMPHALLFNGKFEDAKNMYLELKYDSFNPNKKITFMDDFLLHFREYKGDEIIAKEKLENASFIDAFTEDFKQFEAHSIIPNERIEDYKKIKKALEIN